MSTSGRIYWPLEVVFVTTFVAAIVGLSWKIFGSAGSEAAAWVLLGIAVGAALLLQVPGLTDFFRKGDVGAKLDAINRELAADQQIQTRLKAIADAVATNSSISTRLETIASALNTDGEVRKRIDGIPALQTAISQLQIKVDALSTGLNSLSAEGPIQVRLSAIASQLIDMSAKLDEIKQKVIGQ
jgi:hypothetical protein